MTQDVNIDLEIFELGVASEETEGSPDVTIEEDGGNYRP